MRRPKDYDFTGQKFNRLTFIAPTNDYYRGRIIWQLQCNCGSVVTAIPNDVVRGHKKSCGCFHREQATKVGLQSRKYDPMESSARKIWQIVYHDGDIDFATFLKLTQQDCCYCGDSPSRTQNEGNQRKTASSFQLEKGDFTYNGLDRIDSSMGHNKDNVVPCCWTCNMMKNDLGKGYFLQHIAKICKHLDLVSP